MKNIGTTMLEGVLEKYVNPIFVETGTADGGGVRVALSVGFNRIYSIEINQDRQLENLERFRGYKEVTLISGDSSEELARIMPLIDDRTTFWLDAHSHKRRHGAKVRCPIYEELDIIGLSEIKDHTIMIDDMRVIGKATWGKSVSVDEIISHVLEINPNYKISFEDNTESDNDIMVATI